ncbi:MAG: hypothetical protein Q4A15_09100 [Prevotellaceae bacterium]|nr:hypothetical protein [Prevotellaceae bacterium]
MNITKGEPVYVVTMDWSFEDESGVETLLVTSNKFEAVDAMKERIDQEKTESWVADVDEKDVGDDEEFEYCEDKDEMSWSFYRRGYYNSQHTDIQITMMPFEEKKEKPPYKWKIPVTWSMSSVIEVKAPDLESAMEIARDENNLIPLPKDGYYVDGSWELSHDDVEEVRQCYNHNRPDAKADSDAGE